MNNANESASFCPICFGAGRCDQCNPVDETGPAASTAIIDGAQAVVEALAAAIGSPEEDGYAAAFEKARAHAFDELGIHKRWNRLEVALFEASAQLAEVYAADKIAAASLVMGAPVGARAWSFVAAALPELEALRERQRHLAAVIDGEEASEADDEC